MPTTGGHTKAIRAGRVIGTHVKDLIGKRIGEVADVTLEFDEDEHAYVMSYTRDLLQGAPAGSIEELKRDDGLEFRERSHAYYKVPLEGQPVGVGRKERR